MRTWRLPGGVGDRMVIGLVVSRLGPWIHEGIQGSRRRHRRPPIASITTTMRTATMKSGSRWGGEATWADSVVFAAGGKYVAWSILGGAGFAPARTLPTGRGRDCGNLA